MHGIIFFFLKAFFCNVNLCFSSLMVFYIYGSRTTIDIKGVYCLYHILIKNWSNLTIFFIYKMSITEHSGMIVIQGSNSNCRPLWVTLDPNVVIIRIFSKFPRKDTDNTHSFCLISAS